MITVVVSIFLSVLSMAVLVYATYKIFDLEAVRRTVRGLYSFLNALLSAYPWYLILPAVVLLSGLINHLLTRRTTKRMNAIMNAVSQIRKGEYHVLLPNDNSDLLGELEHSVNALAIQINDTLRRRKEIEQSKDDFIVNIAHDLRTPLTSIIGYLSFISETQLDPKIAAKYANIAFDKSKQLDGLLESLFDVAHFTMDEVVINKEALNLKKFLLQKREEMYPQLHAADMEISLHVPDPALTIYADGALMARVFDNLINNSIRYAKEGRSIDVEAETLRDRVRVSFITHANPVPAGDLERIFDRLYRLDKSRAAGTGGVGLGLFISRRIVELHGGTLTARQAGGGTAFDICLPKQADAGRPPT
jgi:signal transduction histidine kinase